MELVLPAGRLTGIYVVMYDQIAIFIGLVGFFWGQNLFSMAGPPNFTAVLNNYLI